ncbi:hypothetical protein [Nocardiopsis ansamitocini]|uniref:Uncharacterized protein n=1 Tax=Nocardiopsis ansamitocini TaxID=1670832 RepID=A0A9W6P3W7_9ACTN|nr:hypothetical protein [Nocardiopsis ansamitocini]GLU46829.1 hypothetical protein Nans01_11800 [Nocardiopsis ansamitocini]
MFDALFDWFKGMVTGAAETVGETAETTTAGFGDAAAQVGDQAGQFEAGLTEQYGTAQDAFADPGAMAGDYAADAGAALGDQAGQFEAGLTEQYGTAQDAFADPAAAVEGQAADLSAAAQAQAQEAAQPAKDLGEFFPER